MAFPINYTNQTARWEQVQAIVNALTGVAGGGDRVQLTQYNNSSYYALDVKNLDGTNSYGLRVQDSAGNDLLKVYKGNVTLGAVTTVSYTSSSTAANTDGFYATVTQDTAAASYNALALEGKLTLSATSGTQQGAYGVYGHMLHSGAATVTNAYGVQGYYQNTGSGTATTAYGVFGDVAVASSGAVTTAYGLLARIRSDSGATGDIANAYAIAARLTNAAAGTTITNMRGVHIGNWSNSGTVTNSYGLYIDNTVDVGATKYAIYSESVSPSLLSGELRVKGDTGGVASANTITGTSNTNANSTGAGTILLKGSTDRNSSGFLKIYTGTTARYIPFFDAITG